MGPGRALSFMLFVPAITSSLGGGTATDLSTAEPPEKQWEYSVSVSTYVPLHSQDYANPVVTADRDWFHAEARYNYEALKTGSVWLGYNFSFGEKLVFEATPMVGGVCGNSTGFAPGYSISITWEPVEFFTQGEYFIDANTHAENFFYTWSELSCSLTSW